VICRIDSRVYGRRNKENGEWRRLQQQWVRIATQDDNDRDVFCTWGKGRAGRVGGAKALEGARGGPTVGYCAVGDSRHVPTELISSIAKKCGMMPYLKSTMSPSFRNVFWAKFCCNMSVNEFQCLL
jgi:hypothetical protein